MRTFGAVLIGLVIGVVMSSVISTAQPTVLKDMEPSLFLGGVEMKIGMPKDKLLASLNEKYELIKIGDSDSLLIIEKEGLTRGIIGSISFKENKLSVASKRWGSYQGNDSFKFADDLFFVLNNISNNSINTVLIKTQTQREPGVKIDEINFIFEHNKKVYILITESSEEKIGKQVSIEEQLYQ